MKIVLDTNVIISAIFFGGNPRRLMEHLFRDDFSVYVSPEIVQEYFETYNEVHKKYSNRGNPSQGSPWDPLNPSQAPETV